MNNFQNRIWLAYFCNNVGAWSGWLALAPFYAISTKSLAFFGFAAMLRQFFVTLGLAPSGPWFEAGNANEKVFLIEFLQMFLSLLGLIGFAVCGLSEIVPIWIAIRFLLGGISTVGSFKILFQPQFLTKTVLGHLLVTQGTVIFGSLAVWIFSLSKSLLISCLLFDAVTSCFFLWSISEKVEFRYFVNGFLSRSDPNIFSLNNMRVSLIEIYMPQYFPENFAYLLGLASISGFATITFWFSNRTNSADVVVTNSHLMICYGIALWVSATQVLKYGVKNSLIFGLMFQILSCLSSFHDTLFFNLLAYILYVYGFGLVLHSVNTMVMSKADSSRSTIARGSTMVNIGLVFGTFELIYALLFQFEKSGNIGIILRASIASLALLFVFYQRKKRKLSDA